MSESDSPTDVSNPVKENLNDQCVECGKDMSDANAIIPILKGRWSVGPEWYCDDCMEDK